MAARRGASTLARLQRPDHALRLEMEAHLAQPFYRCTVDPVRIALDERVVRDLLGLGEDAVASVGRLRTLLASEPSIHGSKKPQVPS